MTDRPAELTRLALSANMRTELRDEFVAAMGHVAASVSVLTTDGTAGRFGQTVSAMMSVCADPPTLVVGLFRDAAVADAVRTNRCFAVSALSTADEHLARDFAGQSTLSTRYKFDAGWRSLRTGSPVRANAVASFDCHAEQFLVAGTHLLILGRVVDAIHTDGDGLTYRARSYGSHTPSTF